MWNFKLLAWMILCTYCPRALSQSHPGLWPDHVKLQFAGGAGLVSIGVGYSNKKQWLETDLYYGYLPKSVGGIQIHQLTGKLSTLPIVIKHQDILIKPIGLGLLVNYSFGKQYFGFSPENYPFDYYGFPTAFHAGAFFGGQLTKRVKGKRIRRLGVYYEVITFDSELISYINNRNTLKVSDIINIGIGVKAGL